MDIFDKEKHLKRIKSFTTHGMHHATFAHKLIFDKPHKIMIALAYLNSAISYFSAAESLYSTYVDRYKSSAVEDVFNAFTSFSDELLSNASKDHSHQWTDEKFSKFKNQIMTSPLAPDVKRTSE